MQQQYKDILEMEYNGNSKVPKEFRDKFINGLNCKRELVNTSSSSLDSDSVNI